MSYSLEEAVLVVLVILVLYYLVCQLRSYEKHHEKHHDKHHDTLHTSPGGDDHKCNTPPAIQVAQPAAPSAFTTAPPASSLELAERSAWMESTTNLNNAAYDTELGCDQAAELFHHHAPAPSINYQDTLISVVADPRMQAQQDNWASEVAPKSQTSMVVDNMDEAAAVSSQRGHGIYAFRFPGPSQHNPLYITDQDADSYHHQTTKFTFGG